MTHAQLNNRKALTIRFAIALSMAAHSVAAHCDVRKELAKEASALAPLVQTDFARKFLESVNRLPDVTPRKLFSNRETRAFLTADKAAALPEAERKKLRELKVNDELYYTGRYGSPLAYVRALDLVAKAGGLSTSKPRVLDFGYGAIGHLELLAAMDIDVVGVDVDPLLPLLYEAAFSGSKRGRAEHGSVLLLNGRFPADSAVRSKAGGNFDLFLSKNTLKNGYIHPAQKVDKRLTIELGVDDEAFVRAMYSVLKPGGFAMLYNLCPAPAPPGKPYIPWADGRCPFPRALLEKSGFEVLAFDIDDASEGHAMAKALGWDKGQYGMNLKKDLFIWYTLARRK